MSFESNYENACKVVIASRKVARSYKDVHYWEHPTEWSFNSKLCEELGMSRTSDSVHQILVIVSEWNVHKVLKALFLGKKIPLIRINREIPNQNQGW